MNVSPRTLFFSFDGRINRATYWTRAFPVFLVGGLLLGVAMALEVRATGKQGVVSLSLSLGSFWPVLAVTVKRLHDRGRSAWFLLTFFIPVVGAIWLLVEVWALSGARAANRFGDPPQDKGLNPRWVVPLAVVCVAAQASLLAWMLLSPAAELTPALTVDLVEVRPGAMVVTLDGDGETRKHAADPSNLEIVVDYLSADAAEVEPGQRVIIDSRGEARPVEGRVRSIEPGGFSGITALGTEERRVNVLIDLVGDQVWEQLDQGLQVGTRVVVWEAEDALSVPLAALFRRGNEWAVFVDEDGRAGLRAVTVGHRNGVRAEIKAGLEAGERVIVYPSYPVEDGVRIKSR